MKRNIWKRVKWMRLIIDALVFASVFALPWIVPAAAGLYLILWMGWFEMIVVGFFMDALFGSASVFGITIGFPFTVFFLMLIFIRPIAERYFFTAM
jgi:hypothetical protein